MTLRTIASMLCLPPGDDRDRAKKRIIPPWVDGCAVRLDSYFIEAQTLIRQRNELKAIWPEKSYRLDEECSDAIMKVARRMAEEMEFEP